MENSEINVIHVRVDQDREKILAICRLAMLEKQIYLMGKIVTTEEDFFKLMDKHAVWKAYTLEIDQEMGHLYWLNRFIKPESSMGENETELDYEETIAWLTQL
jgi:hypothetical protein